MKTNPTPEDFQTRIEALDRGGEDLNRQALYR